MNAGVKQQIAAAGLLVFVAGAAAANFVASRHSVVNAAAPSAVPQFDSETQCVASVPRAWGEFKGGSSQSGLAFQAADGTLRFVTNLPCGSQPPIALKIVRPEKGSSN
jgi:hypothetical protein